MESDDVVIFTPFLKVPGLDMFLESIPNRSHAYEIGKSEWFLWFIYNIERWKPQWVLIAVDDNVLFLDPVNGGRGGWYKNVRV